MSNEIGPLSHLVFREITDLSIEAIQWMYLESNLTTTFSFKILP